MKALILLLCIPMIACAAKPEQGPYNPTLPSDYTHRGGDLYPSTLAIRPWKPDDPAQLGGRYVDVADPTSTVELRVVKRKSIGVPEWQCDGEWRLSSRSADPRMITWQRSVLELESKHSYMHGARGCLFVFFVQYRDPDHRDEAPRPALLIGDRLLTRE